MWEPPDGSTDEGLRRQVADLRRLVEYAPVAIAMLDRDLRYVAASRRWSADYGLDGADLTGRGHYEVFPEISERWREIHRRCLAGASEHSDEDLFVRADGTDQWLRWDVRPWRTVSGDVGGLVIFSEDVTERKRAERALAASERRLRMALDVSEAAIWSWEPAAGRVEWDEVFSARMGLAPGEPGSFELWLARIHEEDRPRVVAEVERALAAPEQAGLFLEYRTQSPDGHVEWHQALWGMEVDDDGAVTRVTGIDLDATQRHAAADELRESRTRADEADEARRLLLETASQGIVSVGEDGAILGVNTALEDMFGWGRGELQGRSVEDLLPASLGEAHSAHRAAYHRAPRARPMGIGMDLLGRRRDGTVFPVEVSLNHVETSGATLTVAFVTDISARKRAQDELHASRRHRAPGARADAAGPPAAAPRVRPDPHRAARPRGPLEDPPRPPAAAPLQRDAADRPPRQARHRHGPRRRGAARPGARRDRRGDRRGTVAERRALPAGPPRRGTAAGGRVAGRVVRAEVRPHGGRRRGPRGRPGTQGRPRAPLRDRAGAPVQRGEARRRGARRGEPLARRRPDSDPGGGRGLGLRPRDGGARRDGRRRPGPLQHPRADRAPRRAPGRGQRPGEGRAVHRLRAALRGRRGGRAPRRGAGGDDVGVRRAVRPAAHPHRRRPRAGARGPRRPDGGPRRAARRRRGRGRGRGRRQGARLPPGRGAHGRVDAGHGRRRGHAAHPRSCRT